MGMYIITHNIKLFQLYIIKVHYFETFAELTRWKDGMEKRPCVLHKTEGVQTFCMRVQCMHHNTFMTVCLYR